eukprot:TRINITY_DN23763_c1_g1_i2.p3 TRINITY_DN23763_c1_g1~~TRINITY_DN23763_c1_g1_i2.p3  ORF type:complete len:118 (-),score=3.46 TRINITY_DN23763_c1_g1_i2:109-462(-)
MKSVNVGSNYIDSAVYILETLKQTESQREQKGNTDKSSQVAVQSQSSCTASLNQLADGNIVTSADVYEEAKVIAEDQIIWYVQKYNIGGKTNSISESQKVIAIKCQDDKTLPSIILD